METQWYVARTRPLAERAASSELERAGVEIFCPYVRSQKTGRGHSDVPLFPGYVFVRCDLQAHWAAIKGAPHVRGLVQFGHGPCPVPNDVVETLAEQVSTLNQSGGVWTRYRQGEQVRVRSGLTDTLARVVEEPRSPRARVRVLMEFMGQLVQADVSADRIERVPDDDAQLTRRRNSMRRTRGRGRWIGGRGGPPDDGDGVPESDT